MSQKNVIDTKIRFEADIAAITQATKDIQSNLGKLQLSAGLEKSFTSALTKLQNEISNFEAKAARGISTMGDSKALENSGKKILDLYNQLQNQIKGLGTLSNSEISKLFPDSIGKNIKDAIKLLNDYEASHKKAQTTIEQETKELKKQEAELERLEKLQKELQKTPVGSDSDFRKKSSLKRKIEEAPDKRREILDQAQAEGVKLRKNGTEIDRRSTGSEEWAKKIELFDAAIKKAQESYNALVERLEGKIPESTLEKQMQKNQSAIQNTERKVEGLKKEIEELGNADVKGLNTTVEKINELTKLDLKNLEAGEAGIQAIDEALAGLATEELQKVRDYINTLDESALQAVPALENLKNRLDDAGKEAKELTDTQKDMENFKNNVLQFFSIGNAVQLFKRAVSSAIDTVKELDAAMTEIAVVSDYDISDMWDTLPQFTDAANKLGVSIKDMYSATTLYIQQGLDMNASLELATETMKMARIAGLDAAQATDAMTAALRGFNMELNETSAQNVSDVYSKLAAITASDVEEISTAMTKTASIAHNANMEFETTTAFLSQIIETTRESAETAGTAMKTVIARFQELKKDPSEIGEVDGEIVDANKIETALRTIGVSLRDTSGQFRELDDVFLEIAQKWDGLDTNTQRYIATMAAGSRQQSRFIAMMSNYERTMELVSAANNSAGASQEQFEKTLESLDAQLERLSNAWAEFTMGLANNEVIKFGVKLLADLLETINKLSSGAGDLGESIIKLGIAFGALKGGGALLKGLFNNQTLKVLVTGANSAGEKVGFAFGKSLVRKIKDSKELFKGENKDLFKNLFKDLKKPEISMGELLTFEAENLEIVPIQNALKKGLSGLEIDEEQRIKIKGLIDTGELEKLQEANRQIKDLKGNVEVSREMTKSAADSINMIGAAAAAAALAIGSLFQNWGENLKTEGYKELGAIISGLGKALITLGTIMSVVIPLRAQLMAAKVSGAIISIPVLGWIAGIISGLVLLGSVVSDLVETAEEKSERLAKQAEAAEDAAKNAQSAYEDLLDSLDKYDDTQKTLEELIKGTNEWRQALLAANDVVLELLELYPSLSEYIERGADGQLVITEAGKEHLLDEQQDRVVAARQVSAGANIEVAIDDYSRKFDEILKNNAPKENSVKGLNEEALKKLVDLYNTDPAAFVSKPETITREQLKELYFSNSETDRAKAETIWAHTLREEGLPFGLDFSSNIDQSRFDGGFTVYSDALHDISVTTGMTASELRLLGEDIAGLGSASLEAESSIRSSITGVLSVGASEALLSDDYSGKIQDVFADSIDLDEYSVDLEKAKEEYNKEGSDKLSDEELEELYLQKANVDEIPKELAEQGRQGLIDALASLDVLGDVTDAMNTFYSSLNERSEQQKDYAIRAIREDGKGLSRQMAKAYEKYYNVSSKELSADEIKAIYESNAGTGSFDDAARALGYVNEEGEVLASEFAAYLVENAKKTEEAYTEAIASLAFVDDDLVASLEEKGISSDAIKQLGNLLVGIMYTGGTEAANAVAKSFDDLVAGKSVSDIEKLTTALNGLDITSPEGIRTFSEAVKDLQLEVPISEESLNAFEEQIISLGKISEEVSFEQMEEKLKNIKQLMEDIEDREDNYSFSEEEKDQLVEVGISTDDFMYDNVDDWVYVGGSLETLLEDIRTNTDNILAEMRGDLTYALERGAAWESAFSEGLVISEIDYSGRPQDRTLNATTLNELATSTNAENYSEQFLRAVVEALGINKLEDGTVSNIFSLTKEQLLSLIQQDYKKNYDLWGAVYQGNLERDKEYDEKKLESTFLNADVVDLINNESPKQAEMVNNALIAQARKYKVDETLIKDFLKATNQGKTAATKWDKVLLGNAINAKKAQQSYAEVSEEITKITKKYDDLEKEVTNEDVRKIGEVLGLDELGEDGSGFEFVKENLGTIDKAFQGDIESAQELQRLLIEEIGGQEYGVDFNIDGDFSLLMSKFDTLPSEIKDRLAELQKLGLFKVETVQLKGTTVQYEVDEERGLATPRKIPYYYSAEVLVPADAEDIKTGSGNFSGTVGSGTKKTAENNYDKRHNRVQDINSSLREREKLEREYNKLLERESITGQALYENIQKQIEALKEEKELQKALLEEREFDFKQHMQNNSKYSKYGWYDEETKTIKIDWAELEALAKSNPDRYEDVDAYIQEAINLRNEVKEVEDAIDENTEEIEKLQDTGKQDYLDLEERVVSALIQKQQDLIDAQEETNNAIDEAANDMIDSIQKNIDKLRQDRDNEKTEQSIAEKERRLAYLRQDTSGANALEIKKLEEEIANEKESYQDTLIDQALQDLKDQNDAAAEQRAEQIELAKKQLEWAEETGAFNEEAGRILRDGLASGNVIGTELYDILLEVDKGSAFTPIKYAQWIADLQRIVSNAFVYQQKVDSWDNRDIMAEMAGLYKQSGGQMTDEIRALNAERNAKIYANPELMEQGWMPLSDEELELYLKTNVTIPTTPQSGSAGSGSVTEGPMHSLPETVQYSDTESVKKMQQGLNKMMEDDIINFGSKLSVDGIYGPKTQAAVKALQAILNVTQDGWWGRNTSAAFKARADLKKYERGGLVDFTGPAWLDGTKSRPEMVLSARDTENFIILKDLLANVIATPTVQPNPHNENYFDINVQVEEIADDYDVDQMVDRVKQKIYEDGMYRNVNSLGLLR